MPKLTQAALRGLIKEPGRHADGGGLYFSVIGEGKAYFVYRYRLGGKEHEPSIGPLSEWSLKGARDKHKLLVADVAKKIDPRAAKAAAPTAVPTFGDMADAYVQTHETTWRNAKHRYQWRQTLTDYCGPIRMKPVNEIGTADLLAVLKPLWDRAPETASRLRGRIQTVIEAAQALGHIDEDKANCALWKGHLDHLLPPAKKLGARGHHAATYKGNAPDDKTRRGHPSCSHQVFELAAIDAMEPDAVPNIEEEGVILSRRHNLRRRAPDVPPAAGHGQRRHQTLRPRDQDASGGDIAHGCGFAGQLDRLRHACEIGVSGSEAIHMRCSYGQRGRKAAAAPAKSNSWTETGQWDCACQETSLGDFPRRTSWRAL